MVESRMHFHRSNNNVIMWSDHGGQGFCEYGCSYMPWCLPADDRHPRGSTHISHSQLVSETVQWLWTVSTSCIYSNWRYSVRARHCQYFLTRTLLYLSNRPEVMGPSLTLVQLICTQFWRIVFVQIIWVYVQYLLK